MKLHLYPTSFQIMTPVHKDVTERLKELDEETYTLVRRVLDTNLAERHIRGGLATKNKYAERHSKIS